MTKTKTQNLTLVEGKGGVLPREVYPAGRPIGLMFGDHIVDAENHFGGSLNSAIRLIVSDAMICPTILQRYLDDHPLRLPDNEKFHTNTRDYPAAHPVSMGLDFERARVAMWEIMKTLVREADQPQYDTDYLVWLTEDVCLSLANVWRWVSVEELQSYTIYLTHGRTPISCGSYWKNTVRSMGSNKTYVDRKKKSCPSLCHEAEAITALLIGYVGARFFI